MEKEKNHRIEVHLENDSSQIDYPSGTSQHQDFKFTRFEPEIHGPDQERTDFERNTEGYNGDVIDCHKSTDRIGLTHGLKIYGPKINRTLVVTSLNLRTGPRNDRKFTDPRLVHSDSPIGNGQSRDPRSNPGFIGQSAVEMSLLVIFKITVFVFFFRKYEKFFFSRIFNFSESFFKLVEN